MCGSMYLYLKQSLTVYLILQDKYMTMIMDLTGMEFLTDMEFNFFVIILVSFN